MARRLAENAKNFGTSYLRMEVEYLLPLSSSPQYELFLNPSLLSILTPPSLYSRFTFRPTLCLTLALPLASSSLIPLPSSFTGLLLLRRSGRHSLV